MKNKEKVEQRYTHRDIRLYNDNTMGEPFISVEHYSRNANVL